MSKPTDQPGEDAAVHITFFADFTCGDGSPGFREWQERAESVDDFVARMRREVEQGGGYVHCERIVRCDMRAMPRLLAQVSQFGREGRDDAQD